MVATKSYAEHLLFSGLGDKNGRKRDCVTLQQSCFMAKYNTLKLGTFLKKPPTEFFALILIWLLEPQSNGG